jgi:oligosaccharide repeat unit polymerase
VDRLGSMDGRNLLSPIVVFPALWLLGVVLAQIHVVALQRPWSWRMWVVAFLVPAVFVCAGVLAQELVRARGHARSAAAWLGRFRGRLPLRPILALFIVIGYIELAHQFLVAGQVPLFSSNIDAARVAIPGGITIVLTDLLTVAAVVAIVAPPKLLSRAALFELAVLGAALFGFALEGGRGSVILPIVTGALGRILYRGLPRFEWLVATAALVVAILSVAFFVRTAQHSSNAFESEFYSHDLPGVPWLLRPLVPVHLAIAMNFEGLARIVDYFPTYAHFGHWRYDAGLFNRYLPARSATTVSGTQASPFTTNTMAGSFWADGGFVGVTIGVAFVALLSSAAFAYGRLTEQFRYVVVAAYLLYMTMFGLYDNLFTQFPDWLIVAPMLFAVGTVAAMPWQETRRPLERV